MKLLITGATGVAGLEALRYALADPAITHITVLSRRPLPPSIPPSAYADPAAAPFSTSSSSASSPAGAGADPSAQAATTPGYPPYTPTPAEAAALGTGKLTVLAHADFLAYPPALAARLADHAACVWALGRSTRGVDAAAYARFTHDFPVCALEALRDAGVGRGAGGPFRFVYISGEGTDRSEASRMLFARVKGRTENSLLRVAHATSPPQHIHAAFLRPGYFFPAHAHDRAWARGAGARALDCVVAPVLGTLVPAAMIGAPDLGRVAVEVAKGRVPREGEGEGEGEREVWGNREMVGLVRAWAKEGKGKREEL